jgi:hypothetical protein
MQDGRLIVKAVVADCVVDLIYEIGPNYTISDVLYRPCTTRRSVKIFDHYTFGLPKMGEEPI